MDSHKVRSVSRLEVVETGRRRSCVGRVSDVSGDPSGAVPRPTFSFLIGVE
jgi:hypothetical protein